MKIILAEYDLSDIAYSVAEKISGRDPEGKTLREFVQNICAKKISERKEEIEKTARAIEKKEDILLCEYQSDCDGSEPECSADIIRKIATAEGKIRYERVHTY